MNTMDLKKKARNNFFINTIVTLIIITAVFSYFRFIVRNDYLVGYEGVCDPGAGQGNCFVGCNDDTCDDKYYYSKVVKYSPDLFSECGQDITGCPSANICLKDDRFCSVTYCDPLLSNDECAPVNDSQDDKQMTDDKNINNAL